MPRLLASAATTASPEPVQSARILLLCIGAAVLYGIVHDQITARVCLEYFTVAHPHLVDTRSTTVLALCWGVAATWWVGVLLGIPLAITCRAGSPPRVSAGELVRPVGILLIGMAGCALACGLGGGALLRVA